MAALSCFGYELLVMAELIWLHVRGIVYVDDMNERDDDRNKLV